MINDARREKATPYRASSKILSSRPKFSLRFPIFIFLLLFVIIIKYAYMYIVRLHYVSYTTNINPLIFVIR